MKIDKSIEIISNEEETLIIENVKVTNDGGDNMSKPKKKVKGIYKTIIILLVLGIIGCLGYYFYGEHLKELERFFNMKESFYVGSDNTSAILYDFEYNETSSVIRGNKIDKYINYEKDPNNMEYSKVKYNDVDYLIKDNNLVKDYESVVFEKELFIKTSLNMYNDFDSLKLGSLIKKGETVSVIGFDELINGEVSNYKITYKDNTGSISGDWLVKSKEIASTYYNNESHKGIRSYSDSNAAEYLYYGDYQKGDFTDNVMPKTVYSLYLSGSSDHIGHVDEYIKFAKETKINAFVIDIIDDGTISYPAKSMSIYSPSAAKHALNSYDNFKAAIKKLNDAGFYTIARITAFKDTYFAKDHPEECIARNGSPYYHQSAYWPSAYSRLDWEYKVALGIEVIDDLGFNEVQYDYCRFPDSISVSVDYKNKYGETKAEAIQKFLIYATENIHKHHGYVSCDVFGETSRGYVTQYGQYWPAMSNIADVISAMPYTDHYGRDTDTWTNPKGIITTFAKEAYNMQQKTNSKAIVRTWITAYNTPWWNATVSYNADKIEQQIRALYDNGLTGGYMTWIAYTYENRIKKFNAQKAAYSKEYLS